MHVALTVANGFFFFLCCSACLLATASSPRRWTSEQVAPCSAQFPRAALPSTGLHFTLRNGFPNGKKGMLQPTSSD